MISALRLSDEGGSLAMTVVSEGSIPKHQLRSEDGTNLSFLMVLVIITTLNDAVLAEVVVVAEYPACKQLFDIV